MRVLQGILQANVELITAKADMNRRFRALKEDNRAKDGRIAELEAIQKKNEGKKC